MFKLLISTVLFSLLTACASADFGSPNTYQRYDVQRIGQMEQATIIRVRQITIESSSDSSGLTSIVSSARARSSAPRSSGTGAAATSPVRCRVLLRGSFPNTSALRCRVTAASKSSFVAPTARPLL